MALLLRKRLIAIETESTYGTDPTVSGADAVLVRDLSITPQSSDVVSRDLIRPYYGASQQLLANTRVECTFSVELAGSGTAGTAPAYGKALKACGLAETVVANTSVTYDPVSSSFSSVTIHYNIDGVRHKVTGCRGNVALSANVGEIPTLDFTFTGIYNAPDDTALLTPTYANQDDPLIFKNGNTSSFQLLSYAGALQSFSFDLGNATTYRELVGGSKEVLITDRAAGRFSLYRGCGSRQLRTTSLLLLMTTLLWATCSSLMAALLATLFNSPLARWTLATLPTVILMASQCLRFRTPVCLTLLPTLSLI